MIDLIFNEEFSEKVIKSQNLVIVDFFADWCGPCKMLSAVLDKLKAENPDINFYKVNVDDNPQLAEQFEVSSIPNVIFFKNGKIVDRSIGFKTFRQLQDMIDKI